METIKRIVVLAIFATLSTGLAFSAQGNTESQEDKFMKAFGHFIEQVNSDIPANSTQVKEQDTQTNKAKKSKKAKKGSKANEETKTAKQENASKSENADSEMSPHLNSLKKVKKYLSMLKLGRSLEIETGYNNMDDIFPNKYISLQLGNVEDFRSLHPIAFTECQDEDYILYIKEECGREEERTILSQRAIVFSFVENDHYEVTSTPTLYVKK